MRYVIPSDSGAVGRPPTEDLFYRNQIHPLHLLMEKFKLTLDLVQSQM